MIWFVLAAITAATLGVLLLPLQRKQPAILSRADYDLTVYRDQLAEIEKDIERGLLTPAQAEAARAEIHRRMLAANDAEAQSVKTGSRRSRLILIAIIILGIPLGTWLTYMWLGHPNMPGRPYAERLHDPEFIMTGEAEQLAKRLEAEPNAEGYKTLADIWFVLRHYEETAAAYRKIIDMNGGDTKVWSNLGEAISLSHGGRVNKEAHEAIDKALEIDPHNPRAQFYSGLYKSQNNQPRRAVEIWRSLVKDSPKDAPWMPLVKKEIEMVSRDAGIDPNAVGNSKP